MFNYKKEFLESILSGDLSKGVITQHGNGHRVHFDSIKFERVWENTVRVTILNGSREIAGFEHHTERGDTLTLTGIDASMGIEFRSA